MMTEILCTISDLSQECAYFRQKYGRSLEECKTAYETGAENFDQYDDLMAWEFAEQGKAYWGKHVSHALSDDMSLTHNLVDGR